MIAGCAQRLLALARSSQAPFREVDQGAGDEKSDSGTNVKKVEKVAINLYGRNDLLEQAG